MRDALSYEHFKMTVLKAIQVHHRSWMIQRIHEHYSNGEKVIRKPVTRHWETRGSVFFLGIFTAPCSLAFSLQQSASEKGHRHLHWCGLKFQPHYWSKSVNFSSIASSSVNVGVTAAPSPLKEWQEASKLIPVKHSTWCAVTTMEV